MKKKILLVDDEAGLLKVTLLRLSKSGYDALEAATGEEGLELARRQTPDLILLDVFLPGLKGDEVAKIIKADKNLKGIPVVLISAAVDALKEKAKECGADGYLAKPFEPNEMLGMIEKLLAAAVQGQGRNVLNSSSRVIINPGSK